MHTVLTESQKETVLANLALVEHIVSRVAATLPAIHARDDLVQTGILGLIAATVRYDPAQGVAFSTYAGRRIEGAIMDMLRQHDWAPRSVRALERQVSKARVAGVVEDASVRQLSQQLGVSVAAIEQLRRDIDQARVESLDRTVSEEGTPIPLSATVFDPGSLVEETVDNHEMIGYLRDGVKLLPERHRIVIIGFFFEGRSMTELGELLGVTQSRASQIKEEALRMLRSGLDEVYRDPGADDGGGEPGGGPGPAPSGLSPRQRQFNDALATSRPWRERIAAGQGWTAGPATDRVNVRG